MKGSKRTNAILKNAVWGLCALLFLFILWLIGYFSVGKDTVVASPWETVGRAFSLLGDGTFWQAFLETLLRAVIAFCLSALLAFAFALLSYLFPPFFRIFTGVCAFLRALPTMAVLLILLVSFTRAEVPVAVCVLTLFPLLYTAYYNALSGVDKDLLEMSKTFGVPKKKIVFGLYLPSMKNSLILESATGFSFAVKLIVSAEILANVAGSLGGQMQEAAYYAQRPTLFALTLIVCLFSMLVEWAVGLLIKEGV
ncbi:MAG: ABC transporter permease subunit [Clostridia bacterium]|nr:ABC transporter permease subunit [Clostridia bacterium]